MRVLFLDLDTLRPDHLSCYGYHRATSPNIDSVAGEGTVFERYYCPNAPCLPSRASLVTGMYGTINGIVGHSGTAADLCPDGAQTLPTGRGFRSAVSENSLFNVFRKAGMYTASISTFAERHSAWWFNAGLNEQINVGKGGMESGEEVLPHALNWLERNGENDNWMLHINFWDPHTPYRAPADFGNPFENTPLPQWYNEDVVKEHLKHVGPHGLNEISMWNDTPDAKYPRHPGRADDMAGLRRIIDGYDCGIRYMDECIGKIFDLLRSMGIFDDINIIITSDHGENFGELGIYGEHATADEATCRIPMIIRWAGGKPGTRDSNMRTNVDLLPTLAELLGVEKFGRWNGHGYSSAILEGNSDAVRDYVVLTQCAHVCQRSVRFENYLYIKNYHTGYHLFDDEMLFDLNKDPYEQQNIANENRDVCLRAKGMLLDWQDSMMMKSPYKTDPLWTVMREGEPCHCYKSLPAYIERLRATGRSEGAQLLAEKYKDFL